MTLCGEEDKNRKQKATPWTEWALYLLSEDLGVLAVVSNNNKFLSSLGDDLLLQVGGTATLDGIQV